MKQAKQDTPQPSNRRAQILNEAMELFAEKGYHNTSLDEVAKGLGITKAALYYYFRGKKEIISEIMKISVSRMKQAISVGKSKLSPKDKLRKLIQYHVEYNADSKELAKILNEQTNVLPQRTREAINRKKREIDRTLQGILQEGIDNGSFSINDVKIVSYAILGLCNWTYHWYKPDGRLTPEQISEILIKLVENGYLKR